jgi:hypothetical protein
MIGRNHIDLGTHPVRPPLWAESVTYVYVRDKKMFDPGASLIVVIRRNSAVPKRLYGVRFSPNWWVTLMKKGKVNV